METPPEAPPEVPPAIVPEEPVANPTPPADPPSTTPPPPTTDHAGMGGFATGAVQTGVGAGISLATTAVSIGVGQLGAAVPAAAPVTGGIGFALNIWSCCAMPGAIGYVETWIGDALGQDRAGALIPILAGYGGCAIGSITSVAILFVVVAAVLGAAAANPLAAFVVILTALSNPAAGAAIFAFVIGINVLNALILGVTPAIAYAIVSEKKQAGDVGEGMPGLLEPSRPVAATPVVTRRKPGPLRTAMAF